MTTLPVPPEKSVATHVEAEWVRINGLIQDGLPFLFAAQALQKAIDAREALVESGRLDPLFDWHTDLKEAKFHNDFYMAWTPVFEKGRDRLLSHWDSDTKRALEFVEKISLSGMSTILILHGAVAVGALNALAQKSGPASASLIAAAKLGMLGALVGILLLAVGQVLVFERISHPAQTIRSHLASSPRQRKLRAMTRYWNKYATASRIGDYFIYSSLFVFFINCFICYIVLIS